MTPEDVRAVAKELHAYATHFSERDWNYTRNLGRLQEIRYDHPGDSLRFRLRSSLRVLFGKSCFGVRVNRWRVAWHMLARDKNLPDGILNDGNIITHWEEDGEYLQFVQPTVGALIAEWMSVEPTDEWARRIAAEMIRIQKAYASRLDREAFSEDRQD